MILLIDNYDSFTYNVMHALSSASFSLLGENPENCIETLRNDRISIQEVKNRVKQGIYEAIVISPGPGRPIDAGITMDIIRELGASYENKDEIWEGVPILGVCLGHQAIGEVFGGDIVLAPEPVHGKPTYIYHEGKGVFAGLPSPFRSTRYHSLIVNSETSPKDLESIAWTEDGIIMGLQHRHYPWIQGVQFHPESILTDIKHCEILFKNFLSLLNSSKLSPRVK